MPYFPGLDAVAAVVHGPSQAYTTFQVIAPPRPATCAEYGCLNWLNGWETTVPEGPHADLVRSLRGRYQFTETRAEDGQCVFTFPPGQPCFAASQHRMRWEGRERLFQRGGDWRGNPRGEVREFTRADDWVDAFATNQIKVADRLERG
jgi:hypothetical protein